MGRFHKKDLPRYAEYLVNKYEEDINIQHTRVYCQVMKLINLEVNRQRYLSGKKLPSKSDDESEPQILTIMTDPEFD